MEVIQTKIKDLLVLQPKVFQDERGYFFESYNAAKTKELNFVNWVQDNESKSTFGVLRGLHLQIGESSQAKLVRAITGKLFDVAVDLREGSDTYGQWHGELLSGENKTQLYIPRGFAHGFLVLSDTAIFAYKCDNYYVKEFETGIRFDDTDIGIDWPLESSQILLSAKDHALGSLSDYEKKYGK